MRKVILDMLVTLDGFFEGPNGELDWTFIVWDEEFQKYSNNELRSMDAILYGRVAYQKTSHILVDELGPETESTIEFVNNVNNIKKVIFSRTLEKVEGNAKIVRENIAEEISTMKQEPGKDLMLIGGPELVSTFIQLDLIDEYRIGVVPMILGEGKSLFKAVNDTLSLKLIKTETFNSGLVILHYQPISKSS
jgi:dihydrofolate reductase